MSRLAIEIKAGVFVATINARVRDQLWIKICTEWKNPAIMIHSTNNEQGFAIRTFANPEREAVDFDGISLLCRPQSKEENEVEATDEEDISQA
jgi:CRISPR-associated protein Cas2